MSREGFWLPAHDIACLGFPIAHGRIIPASLPMTPENYDLMFFP